MLGDAGDVADPHDAHDVLGDVGDNEGLQAVGEEEVALVDKDLGDFGVLAWKLKVGLEFMVVVLSERHFYSQRNGIQIRK